MWLLHTTTGELRYFGKKPRNGYLILSHVWGADEQTFQDIKALEHAGGLSAASAKIRDCCAFARRRGFEWAWIDTCCIDKTSSAELSESINSMYAWYRESDECVAFLQDVDEHDDPSGPHSQFRRSRWYTRGWTLQELIAPRHLVFVSQNWRIIGTKASLADVVGAITNIEHEILTFRMLHTRASVARRMSWAATRQTTREEDRAYSLLGIFSVSLPTVYGEGDHAFVRLQEEILKHIPDQSVFAWGSPLLRNLHVFDDDDDNDDDCSDGRITGLGGKPRLRALMAVSPDLFVHASDIAPISPESLSKRLGITVPPAVFTLTSYGMHARLPLIQVRAGRRPVWLAVLACADGAGRLVSLILQPQAEFTRDRYFVGAVVYVAEQLSTRGLHCDQYRLAAVESMPLPGPPRGQKFSFAPRWPRRKVPKAKMQEVLIPHRLDTFNFEFSRQSDERDAAERAAYRKGKWQEIVTAPCELVVPAYNIRELNRAHGMAVTAGDPEGDSLLFPPGQHDPREIRLVHEETSETVVITLWSCSKDVFQYLHASVSLHDPHDGALTGTDLQGPENDSGRSSQQEDCASGHVSNWDDYQRQFRLSNRCTVRLVFDTLNPQFAGVMMETEGYGQALYSLTIHINPEDKPRKRPDSGLGVDVPASHLASNSGSPHIADQVADGTDEWKYWDGHVGVRPAQYTDAAEPSRVAHESRRFSLVRWPWRKW